MSFLRYLFFCAILSCGGLVAVERRELPIALKTSLIIPCYVAHSGVLYRLLQCYESQTVRPNEVIIAISSVNDWQNIKIDERILTTFWSFPLRLLIDPHPYSASGNRNRASNLAQGDILIYQDADDLPHPRRIEVIKYFFEHFDITYLTHHYIFEKGSFPNFTDCESMSWYTPCYFSPNVGCNPGIAIARQLYEQIQWPEIGHGEDAWFNQQIFSTGSSGMVVEFPLYQYFRRNPPAYIDSPRFEKAQ